MSDLRQYARHYTRLGFAVVPIPLGMKGPRETGWNLPENTCRTPEEAHLRFAGAPLNMGVLHSASGTATLDVDHQEWAALALAAIGITLSDLQTGLQIQGKNGAKPVYRVPEGVELTRHSISWPHPTETVTDVRGNTRPLMVTLFELRGGPVQDVLPPSIHPDTGRPYEWIGTPPRTRQDIPELPAALLALWTAWDDYQPRLRAACPWAPETPATPVQTQRAPTAPYTGPLRPGDAFREQRGIRELLERNGYQRRGDRYLPPDSKSKVAGVRILTGEDGRERAYSDHGSCALSDGHAHDSFSALIHLEHGGNLTAAVKAAAAELGMEMPARPTPPPSGDAVSLWKEHSGPVFDRFMDSLTAATGHARTREKYMDILVALFAAADDGCLVERDGTWRIEFGGLAVLAERMLYRGRLIDLTAGLKYLSSIGMIGRVTSTNPRDKYAPLAVEVTADPRHLPHLTFPGRLSLKSTSYTTARRKASQTVNSNMDTRGSRTMDTTVVKKKPNKAVVSIFTTPLYDARFVLYWVRRGARSVEEIARSARMRAITVRKHLASLEAAGLILDLHVLVSKPESDVLVRLEVESDPAYRTARLKYLNRSASFGAWGEEVAGRLGAPKLQARRHATLSRAAERHARLMDGEPCGVVFGVAA